MALLTGTIINWGGPFQGNLATYGPANAFDGSLTTYYDSAVATGAWLGLALAVPAMVTEIKYAARSDFAGGPARMTGGIFQGANDISWSDAVTLHTISTEPPASTLVTVTLGSPMGPYKFLRYVGPTNSYCDIAEFQPYGDLVYAGWRVGSRSIRAGVQF